MSDEEPDLIDVLQWIGTSLEKLVDIQMTTLDPADSEFLDFVHNTKQVFMSELSQEQLDALLQEFQQSQGQTNEEK